MMRWLKKLLHPGADPDEVQKLERQDERIERKVDRLYEYLGLEYESVSGLETKNGKSVPTK